MSRLCREKGAVEHDDRIDALSPGVPWCIASRAQSAHNEQAMRKNEEREALLNACDREPQMATAALALGHSFKARAQVATTGVWDWS